MMVTTLSYNPEKQRTPTPLSFFRASIQMLPVAQKPHFAITAETGKGSRLLSTKTRFE
jgi:hypothetical protein